MGAGEPLMVVHGGPLLDHGYMEPWLRELSSDYRLVFMDQRLSGRSSPESDSANVTLDRFTEDIEAVRRHLGLDRVHLLGHSWGGFLALRYALAYPQSLRSLTLVSPMPPSSAHWQAEQQALSSRLDPSYLQQRDSLRNTPAFRPASPKPAKNFCATPSAPSFTNRPWPRVWSSTCPRTTPGAARCLACWWASRAPSTSTRASTPWPLPPC
ncbi:MAG: alpha/beta fold hydrolase [Balneolaceae bacterium]|nr:alpha/beta fold hydrolase [Balneolaceae bacterium]